MDTLNRIIDLMQQNNISQKALTDFLSINKVAFSEWKSGKSNSYLKYISQIAEFLGVSTDYLLGNEQKKESPLSLDSEQLKLFNDIKSLTPEQQQALRVIVDSYKKK